MKLVKIFMICLLITFYINKILKPRDLYLIYKTDEETLNDLKHSLGY